MGIDDTLGDEVRVTVIAAGFDERDTVRPERIGTVASFQTLDEDIDSAVNSGGQGRRLIFRY